MKILVLALTITVALGAPYSIWEPLHFRSRAPISMFTLSIIPELNQPGKVSIQTNTDSTVPANELISPVTGGYNTGEVWQAANIAAGTRWNLKRINDTTIQYVVNTEPTGVTEETNDIASTSFSNPRHADDFKLFMQLPITVDVESGEIDPESRRFCIDVHSEFYVKDGSGNLVKTNFNLIDVNVPDLVDGEGVPLTRPPTETFCARYFEVHDIPRGSDEGESDSSVDDDNDDDDGKSGGSSDSADDDDYLKNPTTAAPTEYTTAAPTTSGGDEDIVLPGGG